jgi:hypothetical protein
MARALREKAKVYIFDGSETWSYGFDKIPTFTIEDRSIRLLGNNATIDEIERYQIDNWHLIELALNRYHSLLFRLKTRKPSKRGFFVRQVVNYLDTLQREARQTTEDNEAKNYIAYFIEEAQDCFNSRSTTRLESEEFLSVFNGGRNQKESFFTASQRLTDFSKTIRTKQIYCIGRVSEEDKGYGLRRIEKFYNLDFSRTPQRSWFVEGLNKSFLSPEWSQRGKPFQINNELRRIWNTSTSPQKPQKEGLLTKIVKALFPQQKKTYRYSEIDEEIDETDEFLENDFDEQLDEEFIMGEDY